MDCVFCAIARGRAQAWRLYEDDECVAFLDLAPARRGHSLVIPKLHVPDVMAQGGDAALRGMATAVHVVARALMAGLRADGISVFQSNGVAAGQEVFHLHVHLVPRHVGDGRLTVWERDASEADRLADTHALLRAALS